MKETEERHRPDEQKEKIRARYKGVSIDELDVIPATPVENFYDDTNKKRVAVYARVSTGNPQQTTSFELQKNYYMETIARHPGWELVEIYADEGTLYGLIPKTFNIRFSRLFTDSSVLF